MLSWQGEVVKIDFYGENKGEGRYLSWSEEEEHLKERGKVLASFELIEKEEKAEKWK